MRWSTLVLSAMIAGLPLAAASAGSGLPACANSGKTLGVARIVEIDTSTGALFGALTRQSKEPRFLEPKEVVLTFDDGPMPPVTRAILDTLDRFCTKATFFSVGQMALAYPSTVRSIIDRGHTIGSHTWSHPLNLKRLPLEKAIEEIEKGHAAVTLAAGQPIAPFFRFPGLSDSAPMLAHLQKRGIASFTVDAVSNDSYIGDPGRLYDHVMKELEAQKGGIVLFHDIKPATARMLPRFLAELQARGYRIVHMKPKGTVMPVAGYTDRLAPILAKSEKSAAAGGLVPFYGVLKPGLAAVDTEPAKLEVTEITPAARKRSEPRPPKAASSNDGVASTTHWAHIDRPGHAALHGWSARLDAAPEPH